METLAEYTKFTLTLAVAILLYIPAEFLPAGETWESGVLILTVVLAGVSAFFGLMLYTRITDIIVKDSKDRSYR